MPYSNSNIAEESAEFVLYYSRFTIYDSRPANDLPFTTNMTEQDVIKETKPRMESAIDDFRRKLATVRTGRASVSLLDTVMIDYYGTPTPLKNIATINDRR